MFYNLIYFCQGSANNQQLTLTATDCPLPTPKSSAVDWFQIQQYRTKGPQGAKTDLLFIQNCAVTGHY